MKERLISTPPLWGRAEPTPDENGIWLPWLVRLRWVALFAQLIMISFAFRVLWSPWLLLILGCVMLGLTLGNLDARRTLKLNRPISSGRLFLHLTTEIIALTVFLVAAGGPDNPFIILYVIHVAMAAVMLKQRHALLITACAILCYAIGFLWHLPLILEAHSFSQSSLIKGGQVIAFAVTSISVCAFVMGVAGALRYHRTQLLAARDRTARTDRLRSVGTLAAGAAHNLNTPLSTIGLRLRRVRRRHEDKPTDQDLQAIFNQLDRCKDIVEQLLVGAGDPSASQLAQCDLGTLVKGTIDMWSKGNHVDVLFEQRSKDVMIEIPRIAFSQALTNLLENAREAQHANGNNAPIRVTVERIKEKCVIQIIDQGIGLPSTKEQVGEPFFTTKHTGTGLGVYVARAVAQGAGGGLGYDTSTEKTTVAKWWFPASTPRRTMHVVQSQTDS